MTLTSMWFLLFKKASSTRVILWKMPFYFPKDVARKVKEQAKLK